MLLNTYYYNVNYFVRSLMRLVYDRTYYMLSIYYKLLAMVRFRNHLANGVCDNSKSCDTCSEWLIGPVLDHVCNILYCSYCSW